MPSRLPPSAPIVVATLVAAIVGACSAAVPITTPTTTLTAETGSPSAVPTEAPQPSPSGPPLLPEGTTLFPGTYLTRFDPAFSLTIARGEADVSGTSFINYTFGQNPGSDFFVNRIDKVQDLQHPGALLDPPSDLVGWLSTVAGRKLIHGPLDVKVGGLDAMQFDVLSGSADEGLAGADPDSPVMVPPGLPAQRTARMTLVKVMGRQVLFTGLAQEVGTTHFQAAQDVFQPMIDSIVWTSLAATEDLAESGASIVAGTYRSHFEPALTFSADPDLVKAVDCAPGFQCRGDVDVNTSGWVGLEFGSTHGTEIDLVRLDKVFDPSAPTELIDPPKDLATWFKGMVGSSAAGTATAVTIGGLPALRFDVHLAGDVQLGPIPGQEGGGPPEVGPNAIRVFLARAHGQVVLISEFLGARNTTGDRAAVLAALQPLIDSITWQ